MPDYKNAELHKASLELARVALEIVRKDLAGGARVPAIPESKWTERDKIFLRQTYNKPLWVAVVGRAEKPIQSTEEYKQWERILSADPTISRQLNALLGTADQRMRVDTNQLCSGFISQVIEDAQGPTFDADIASRRYGDIERALYSDELMLEELAPLIGFETTVPEVRMADDLSIVRLSLEDLNSCLSMGVIRPGPPEDILYNPPRYAIKKRWREPKVVSEADADKRQLEFTVKRFSDAAAQISGVFHALRLFKPGQCFIAGSIRRPVDWLISYTTGGSTMQLTGPLWFTKYQLNEAEIDDFKRFWENVRSVGVKNRRFLGVAISRFSFAKDRQLPEDKIIDLMIASEALFLCDIPEDRGELRYRLSLRAGFFLGKTPKERRGIFRLMRSAYAARSAIVHGGRPKLPREFTSLKDFADRIEELVRGALQNAIVLAAKDGTPEYLVDWDDLIFPGDKK